MGAIQWNGDFALAFGELNDVGLLSIARVFELENNAFAALIPVKVGCVAQVLVVEPEFCVGRCGLDSHSGVARSFGDL